MCVAEMFANLKRNMEQDLVRRRNIISKKCFKMLKLFFFFFFQEKIALPLIQKTGDTNKFLREDCHVALVKVFF